MPNRFSPEFIKLLQQGLGNYVEAHTIEQNTVNAMGAIGDSIIEAVLKQCPAEDKISIIRQTIAAVNTPEVQALQQKEHQLMMSGTGIDNLDAVTAISRSFSPRELELLKSGPLVLEYAGKEYQIVYTTNGSRSCANVLPV